MTLFDFMLLIYFITFAVVIIKLWIQIEIFGQLKKLNRSMKHQAMFIRNWAQDDIRQHEERLEEIRKHKQYDMGAA